MYGLPVYTFTSFLNAATFPETSRSLTAIDFSLSFVTWNSTWKLINGVYSNTAM